LAEQKRALVLLSIVVRAPPRGRETLAGYGMRRPFSIASSQQQRIQRWPLVVGNAPPPRSMRGRRIAAVGFGITTLLGSIVPWVELPLVVRVVLGIGGLLPIMWAAFAQRPAARPSGTYVEADLTGLSRITEDGTKSIVTWDMPFGVALLASYGRPTALLAFTTPTQTRYVPARIDDRSEADDELLARIAVLADLDLVDGVAHDAALTSTATAAIVRHVEGRDKNALGRVYLSDGKGLPIALDRATLAVGERRCRRPSSRARRTRIARRAVGSAAR
jgi:hypothetical protein